MAKKKESHSGFVDIRLGDCLELLKSIPDSSIDFMLTDPPYFLDQLDDKWSKSSIEKNMRRSSAIG